MKLINESSPHIKGSNTTSRLMLDVVISLLPALAMGVFYQGARALAVALVSIAAAVASEAIFDACARKKQSVLDFSAAVTGLLFAMTLPATVPYWLVAIGSSFSIVVVKCLSGGLGQNIFNPALAGRAFIMLFWPTTLIRYAASGYHAPLLGPVDIVTSATPLHSMVMPALPSASLSDMILGRIGGTIGEVSAIALLIGAAYLVLRGVISLRIPLSYIGTVALLSLIFPKTDSRWLWMCYQVTGGGLILGAFFMATDYVSSPTTGWGQVIYGAGCGILTIIFRYTGLYPEGVTYSILIMNSLSWILDRYTSPRIFGTGRRAAL
ncbi:MAG: RnfABCDGE type electron transport complex subunit D [Candidatus Ornithospirochaeta sp.]|nr:RnfABCDGE type electron transport complex subunit D [Candidatus Ornithospirochaeta sp.]